MCGPWLSRPPSPDPVGIVAECPGEAVCPQRPRVPASLSLGHGLSALWPLSTQLKGQGQPAEAAAALPTEQNKERREASSSSAQASGHVRGPVPRAGPSRSRGQRRRL